MSARTRLRVALAALASAALAACPWAAAHADQTATTHLTGTLADGATWIADVPDRWNGTLLLFSPLPAPYASSCSPRAMRWPGRRTGNNSWNRGVDYARLLAGSAHARQVRALYRTAGLDLRADLASLTRGATIAADPAAVRTARRTSSAGQGLAVPLLDVHTIADNLVPVEQERQFGDRVRRAGDGAMLRQAYVERQGHCTFTTAETVAALHALEHRVTTGRWDDAATPAALQRSATALGLDGAAYVPYRPARLTVGRDRPEHPARH
ncbi:MULTISPECIES: hypothetical protein [Streptomyces]|uniref:Uncharacterized protein n=2 Tax=Streptomyces TaxID=1883 RepID=A0ABD5JEB4_9ACTN|nr:MULTISPECIES: hypothetical protein [Streptomyces]MEE4586390.1 hypothetical protein [Streptomyces sp. DSM 41602]WTB03097.1 hypothetical protein OG546_01910 [Streptomyces antimycoticus]